VGKETSMESRVGGVEMGRDVENCPLKWMKTHGRCKKRLEDPQCLRLIAEPDEDEGEGKWGCDITEGRKARIRHQSRLSCN
jgi:hypothetical protein